MLHFTILISSYTRTVSRITKLNLWLGEVLCLKKSDVVTKVYIA